MVRKKEKSYVTREENEFIWEQVHTALEILKNRQEALNAHQQHIIRNPEFFKRGCAM